MKKTYQIEVDCANCANLMEEAAKKTEGVESAVVNFMTQKMIVEFREGTDPKTVMKAVLKNCETQRVPEAIPARLLKEGKKHDQEAKKDALPHHRHGGAGPGHPAVFHRGLARDAAVPGGVPNHRL